MTEPTTEAGRALWNGMREKFEPGTLGRMAADEFGPALAEVEAEAAAEPTALLRELVEVIAFRDYPRWKDNVIYAAARAYLEEK